MASRMNARIDGDLEEPAGDATLPRELRMGAAKRGARIIEDALARWGIAEEGRLTDTYTAADYDDMRYEAYLERAHEKNII